MESSEAPDSERDLALQSLRKKQSFKAHVVTYLAVNAFLVVIWAVTTPDDLFWPVFPIVGWGIGLAANAWDAYGRKPITEEDIEAERERLRARGATTPVKEAGLPGEGRRAP